MKKLLTFTALIALALTHLRADIIELLTPTKRGFKCAAFTRTWEKDNGRNPDFLAIPKLTGNSYQVTFTGTRGGTSLYFMMPTPTLKPGEKRDLFLDIQSNQDMIVPIHIYYHEVKEPRSARIILKKGTGTYQFLSTGHRTWTPDDFEQMRAIYLVFQASQAREATLTVRRIFLQTQNADVRKKTQETIIRRRRAEEIMGTDRKPKTLIQHDDFLLSASWDQRHIFVHTKSRYNTKPPIANTLPQAPNPELVFQDDCQELFFSGHNDNQKYIQIVENPKGAQWSARTDWDPVAAAVISWKAPAKGLTSKHRLDGSWWKARYAMSFQLAGIHLNESNRHFLGFQFAHKTQNGQQVVFNPAKRFPPPENYGLLVLNNAPFGRGEMTIDEVQTIAFHGRDTMGMKLTASLTNMPESCTYRIHVTAPDHTVQTFRVAGQKTFQIGSAKDLGGLYTVYLEAINPDGNRLVTAVDFVHQKEIVDRIGQLVIMPKPKKLTRQPGSYQLGKAPVLRVSPSASTRTRKTATLLAQRLRDHTLIPFHVTSEPGTDGILLCLNHGGKPEGYQLAITDKGIRITGNDEPGLHYGGVTLMQIVLSPMKRTASLPCLTIDDWPDLPKRVDALGHPWHFKGRTSPEPADLNFMIEHLQRYMSDSKMNAVILDLSCNIAYKNHPELTTKRAIYDHDDLKRLADWGRDHFLSIILNWECGGHSAMWLNAGPGERCFKEPGFDIVAHPIHNKIVFDCIGEIVDVMKPDYVQFGGDEWWWPGDFQSKDTVNGKTHAQNMLDFYLEVANFCRKHGCRPLLWADMLNPKHNGQKFGCWKILDNLPKDFIFLPWGYLDQTINYFADKGFDTWCITTGLGLPTQASFKRTSGFGGNALGFMILSTPQGNNARTIWNADYGWNAYSKPRETLTEAVIKGYVAAAHRMRTQRPNPEAENTYVTLAGPESGKTVALIPGECTEELTFPVRLDQKAASLVFLHHVKAPERYCRHGSTPGQIWAGEWRNWQRGLDCGNYVLEYEDGTTIEIPLRLKNTIGLAHDHAVDGLCWDCRYEFAQTNENGSKRFYQYEWVNPYPRKTLKTLHLKPSEHFPKFNVRLYHIARRLLK